MADGERNNQNPPGWCQCENCREMPTEVERVCCKDQRPDDECPVSNGVIDQMCEEVAERLAGDHCTQDNRRRKVYQEYTKLKHGKLGRNRRIVISSCVMWRTRDAFPAPDGNYMGFVKPQGATIESCQARA